MSDNEHIKQHTADILRKRRISDHDKVHSPFIPKDHEYPEDLHYYNLGDKPEPIVRNNKLGETMYPFDKPDNDPNLNRALHHPGYLDQDLETPESKISGTISTTLAYSDQQIWVRIYAAAISSGKSRQVAYEIADLTLIDYKDRFPNG